MKQVYVVHGYNASPAAHWFPWLKEKLQSDGIETEILHMPHPAEPKLGEWVDTIAAHANRFNRDTYVVAHSLGGITLLRYLETANLPEPVGGMVLVSGFTKALPNLPILDEFTAAPLDFAKIKAISGSRSVIAAKDDGIVPFASSKELAQLLDAEFYELERGGHFLGSEGFTSFPLVYELLKKGTETC